jgi:hypothetical protein
MLARGEIDPATVREFDQASKGMKLPQKAGRSKGIPKHVRKDRARYRK